MSCAPTALRDQPRMDKARTRAAHTRPLVLIYRSNILPRSETFIKEQMLACRTWRSLLIGRQQVHELALDGLRVQLLESGAMRDRLLQPLGFGLGALRREQPRLLHAHFGPEAVAAAPMARALGIPLLVTLHGYDINVDRIWWENGHGGQAMRNYPRRLLALASRPDTHFIAVSHALRGRAIAYGIPPEKVTTHYIGVDAAKFAPGPLSLPERPPRVLFV
jgi:glycosyltransferase involved in cell wall biosynthesis